MSLPNTIIPISNSDKKGWTEAWTPNRNLLNIPHPYRCILIGPPSSGKSTAIKNMLIRAKPPFEEIMITHYNNESSEYADITEDIDDTLPDPLGFDNEAKRCLIIEDLNLKMLQPEESKKLNRLCGYTSSHCNLTIFITCQNYSDLNASIRRMANLFVIFRNPDISSMSTLANRVGLSRKQMGEHLIALRQPHDSLWIDLTRNTPKKIRINGFE